MRSLKKTPWTKCASTAVALSLLASVALADDSRYEIRLIEKSWTPEAGVSAASLRSLEQRAAALPDKAAGNVHALVQLYEIPDEAQRARLEQDGIMLGAFVPGNAFMATITPNKISTLAERSELRALIPWTAERKTHPRLKTADIASWARDPNRPEWVMTMVLLHSEVDLSRGRELAEKLGGAAMEPIKGVHGLTIWLPEKQLAALAQEEDVLWIEEGPAPLTPNNDGIRRQMNVDGVAASPYLLDGSGVDLLVFDGGRVLADHQTFDPGSGSRVTSIDSASVREHATHVAGTAAGDGSGSSGGRGLGVAPAVDILSAGYEQIGGTMLFWDNAGDIQTDYSAARNSHGADIATNSIGSNTAANGYPCSREGDYGVTSNLIDGIVRGDNASVDGSMIVTWAAGNERHAASCGSNYNTSAPPACAKNPIQVGAIHSDGSAMTWFSSWGPCDDGRLKPIVVAPGCETGRVTGETFIYSSACETASGVCTDPDLYGLDGYCGTSMATPAVAGSLALLYQDWNDHTPFLFGYRPLPSLVKALTIHSARDLGTLGPDYRSGYGAVDTRELIDLYRAGTGSLSQAGPVVFGSDSVTHNVTDSLSFTVPAGVGVLKATLAWDDAAAAAFSATALVNNLDLWLEAPGGAIVRPWVLNPASPQSAATQGINNRDNQEQVVVIDPAAGTWTLRVRGANVPSGPQTYGLVYSYEARTVNESACAVVQTSSFETGNDSWTLSGGAARVAAPGTGHGSFSVLLGGANNATHTASRTYTVPIGGRYEWSFDLYVQAASAPSYLTYDSFFAEVRDAGGNVLSVLDFHNNGEILGTWLPQVRFDLTRWGGQTIQLVFFASTNASNITSFWVDDVRITSCVEDSTLVRTSFTSTAAEDGHVIESTETSSVGGTVDALGTPNPFSFIYSLRAGDWTNDEQVKGFLSFDTSALPDGATILWARVRLRRNSVSGVDPFTTHGNLYASMRTGAFNGNAALESSDWQAAATAGNVSLFSQPFSDGAYSYATLNSAGLAAINKTGLSQFKLGFFIFDDDDLTRDTINFAAGESSTASHKPTLEIAYLP